MMQLTKRNVLRVKCVATVDNISDPLFKHLQAATLQKHLPRLGLRDNTTHYVECDGVQFLHVLPSLLSASTRARRGIHDSW